MAVNILTLYHNLLKTDHPYPYQIRLAERPLPDLLNIPTGLGKTAAVLLAWLCKRANHSAGTPRRLVWCLPMRVLVEQTVSLAKQWCQALLDEGICQHAPKVYMLKGGNIDRDWDACPEDDAILVGTQDQLLSRALNRGYAMSRFRWTLDFAQLNNDCLWVFDEIQLMGAGLQTSTQLDAFRAMLGTVFPCRSLWISATMDKSWLASIDFAPRMDSLATASLQADDLASPQVKRRLEAVKPVSMLAGATTPKALTTEILKAHRQGTLTIVIRNTVKDATATWTELSKELSKRDGGPELVLLHSRFRPADREDHLGKALAPLASNGRIIVSTQVVEAGVDISATTLFTDMAPWPSLVQRFGRCNRYGEQAGAAIYWIDRELTAASVRPYSEDELAVAREKLLELRDASPATLPKTEEGMEVRQVLRKQDMLDLFDTTPDLAGEDVDVSPYIRSSGDMNVYVFWRDCDRQSDSLPGQPQPSPEELCPVPVGELQGWLAKHPAWWWDFDAGEWRRIQRADQRAYPGARLLLCRTDGGYSAAAGWDATIKAPVPVASGSDGLPDADARLDGDGMSEEAWQDLTEHCVQALDELKKLLALLDSPVLEAVRDDLEDAVRNHDWGKLHALFQEACTGADTSRFWAKAPHMKRYAKRGFRHELASALAMLAQGGHSDLAVWLAASHHGKVGLSIRSLPGEDQKLARTTRGIADGDELPACGSWPRMKLKLECMELGIAENGSTSWLDRALGLLEEHGPFKLAFLSALVRIADWRASASPAKEEC